MSKSEELVDEVALDVEPEVKLELELLCAAAYIADKAVLAIIEEIKIPVIRTMTDL